MKKSLLIFLITGLCSLPYLSEAWDGICPKCKVQGAQSRVYPGGCSASLIFCGSGYYDVNGNYNPPHDCNKITCKYSCSRGHEFIETMQPELNKDMFRTVCGFKNFTGSR